MKLTKKLQAEITALMNDYWNSYFSGDLAHWGDYLVDDYRNIGGTEEEIWNSKKEILEYTFRVIDQMVGKTEIKNKIIQIIPYDPYFMVHEFMDLFIKVEDEWSFYGKFRLSSLIQHTPSGWKVLHQHGSYPDSHTEQGEAFAFDKLKKENTRLQEEVKRRTIELENKNRELEIETSLERVRTVAMAMKKPDDILEICKGIFSELRILGFSELRNSLINFWDDVNNALIDYDYSDYTGGHKANLSYSSHPVFEQFQKKIRQSKDSFAELVIEEDLLESWKQRRRDSNEYEDPRLENINALYYYFYSIGVGSVGISTFSPLTKEKLNILKRFRNVFDLAYRRYKDVENAEAQAKEAHVEAALEKVRSRSLLMHKSDELNEVVLMLFEQFISLGISIDGININILNENRTGFDSWFTAPGYTKAICMFTPFFDSKVMNDIVQSIRSNDELLERIYTKQEKNEYFSYLYENSDYRQLPEERKKMILAAESWRLVVGMSGNSGISIHSYTGKTFTDKDFEILIRFAKVFHQTYTRFLDLQKAESQAREAQIEAAVERIRSKALAMHKSKDLHGVVITLKKELLNLNIRGVSAVSMYLEQDDGSIRGLDLSGMTDGEEEGSAFKMDVTFKLEDTDPDLWIRKIWNCNEHYFVIEADEADFERIIKWLYTIDEKEAAIAEKIIKQEGIKKAWLPTVKLEKGKLNIDVLEPPTPEIETILVKIGAAFDLAYTRFLDLQKAEAQAIEAKIEVALERVRSKAMAMHTSKELIEVAKELRKQVGILGTKDLETCAINLYEESPDNVRAWAGTRPADSEGEILELDFLFPKKGIEVIEEVLQAYQSGIEELVITVEGAKLMEWLQVLRTALPDIHAIVMDSTDLENIPESKVWWSCAFFPGGCLVMITMSPPDEVSRSLLKRFSQVFGMAYRRFADLKKAEAQTREAQIEVAVERVRAKALAMHKSDEIMRVVLTMRNELESLNIPGVLSTSITLRQDDGSIRLWDNTSTKQLEDGLWESTDMVFRLEENNPEFYFNRIWNTNEKYFVIEQYENDLPVTVDWVRSFDAGMADTIEHYFKENDIKHCWHPGVQLSHGKLNLDSLIAPEPEMETILLKMGAAFDLAYKRFLDLKKAEAQAREAQIETALERVRSGTMSMHKSNDLLEVIKILADQLAQLDFKFDNVSFGENNQDDDFKFWIASAGEVPPLQIKVPYMENPAPKRVKEAQKKGLKFFADLLSQEENRQWSQYLIDNSALKLLPDKTKDYILKSIGFARSTVILKNINIYIGNYKAIPYSENENRLFQRFALVFEQSYTRFLDLQKAEAQAREAQIEAALERVRSRSNAMQRSENLFEVISEVNDQLLQLGFRFDSADFMTDYSEKGYKIWLASAQETFSTPMYITSSDTKIPSLLKDVLERGDDFFTFTLNREEKNKYFEHVFNTPEAKNASEESKQYVFNSEGMAVSCVVVKNIILSITNFACIPYTDSENDIIKRFGFAFEQSYTRFLDLQKAEAQAREAQIEAALERVRSRTIGMQKSEELREVIQIVFEQLRYLDFKIDSAHFNLNYKESDDYNLWTAAPGQPYPVKTYIPYFNHPVFDTAREAKEKGLDFFTESYTREEKNEFFEHLFSYAPGIPEERRKYILSGQGVAASTVLLNQISLWIMNYSGVPYSAAENGILKRFGKIFEQSHTRFLDLQKAEAQAKEAIKQASLDRIRAEIASMRTTGDLEAITPLIWKELTVLGVPFIRCGVFIMNDLQRIANTYLSTPDGKAIAAFDLAYDTPGNISQIVRHWQDKKLYIDYWDEEAYTAFAGNLVQKGIFISPEQYFSTLPGGGFYLHFAPFLQGMLYVGNTTQLSNEEINLIQSVANAFATAYARYEDFNKLEAAKKQVDNTLNELQLTQKQLIQSEKMASLGELTAGVAHEIQNPLNFVNNFSELNKELLLEMNEEIEKGNINDVKSLAKVIIENEQKINHHGKRADAIVKGMLQHSRSNNGQKEPTDINELADEYLRLAYHGFRAKDKNFNATLVTDYDDGIGKINIIPQDIGRVVLNLINNAFYTCTERSRSVGTDKKKKNIAGYEPSVSISTRKLGDKIEIKVRDNGNGIPPHILNKIFQPFFTTKPTGQGTGLGLSLAYDIVKAHGGELKVETKENVGTEFIISIPN